MKKILLLIITLVVLFSNVSLYAQHQHQAPPIKKETTVSQKKIKYWTCGMHPQVKQDKPGNCPICNMKLIPIYEEETVSQAAPEEAIIKLSSRDISLAGIKSEPVTLRHLFKEIRTVGRIAYDPESYKAEEEYIQALKAQEDLKASEIPEIKKRASSLVEAAGLKLRLLGLGEEQIKELATQNKPDSSLIISNEENPFVWVYADIYEYELSWIRIGQPMKIYSVSFPDEEFRGKIEAVDPVLNPMTRSVRIRAKIDNPQLKLKPQMYVDIFIESYLTDENDQHKLVLAIPKDAVLDTGLRKIVYLDLGGGSYLGKEVKVGPEAISYVDGEKQKFYPVVGGLKENDLVVTKGNFLIDSQSQITGVAAGVYGGALGVKEETKPHIH
ncbi:MAG: efflux RND transporter periplasmic adaptor subunit [Candidatus Omnitrophota bacterium]